MVALYLRYRPDSFSDVVGQTHVTVPLGNALKSGRTHHAYLFSGPRGCGKTTSARILARCLNCEKGPTDTPCGVCPSCVELSRDGGGSLDVVEIDAASHNGVDDARELRERAVFAPARDRYKVFILDEAHMVTQQGFNALLKIVEEPPEHVKFIFATTEPDKVLTTIRSRTHHYPFRLVPPGELVDFLSGIATNEGIELEEGVLALVVQAGGGSVRDSLSILDQLIAGSDGPVVTINLAQQLLGFTPRSILSALLEALANNRSSGAYSVVQTSRDSGHDPRRFVEDLLGHLRDLIVVQAVSEESPGLFPGVPEDEVSRWRDQTAWFSPEQLSHVADATSLALSEMSGVTSPTLHLELLVARALRILEKGNDSTNSQASSSEVFPEADEGFGSQQVSAKPVEEKDASNGRQVNPTSKAPIVSGQWGLEQLSAIWPAILDDLASQKRSLWVALSNSRPLNVEGDVVKLGFEQLRDAEILKKPQGPGSPLPNADLLRDAIVKYAGQRVRFTIGELEGLSEPATQSATEDFFETDDEQSTLDAESQSSRKTDFQGALNEENEAPELSPVTQPLATRGEPVVRQLLGGELVGEEILESMSDHGEADV